MKRGVDYRVRGLSAAAVYQREPGQDRGLHGPGKSGLRDDRLSAFALNP